MSPLSSTFDTCPVTEQTQIDRGASSALFRLAALLVTALAVATAAAQGAPAATGPGALAGARPLAAVIDDYVRAGLRTNRNLRSSTLDIERSQAALDAARARYVPDIALDARYTRAEGGREITLPVAALGNPTFSLVREREQDTRVTLRQPLFAPAIPASVRAQRAGLEASEFARLALARHLKRDISVGYLDWLQASRTIGIVTASRTLLIENLRVNDSLFRNGKITQDQVLRARAELLAVEQQLREAQNGQAQAQSYLNFLLNRELDQALENAEPDLEVALALRDLATLRAAALENRPELDQVDRSVLAAGSQLDIARSALWPTLSLGAEAGTQGEAYEFGRGRNVGTISLLLNWKLFDGGTRRAEVRAARAGERQARIQREELQQQIQLEVQQSLDRLDTTSDSLRTADARAEAARAGFRIASRKRDEGAISQVEFIDARSALTAAELNLNLTRFQLLARQAELDYATAAGTLPAELGISP